MFDRLPEELIDSIITQVLTEAQWGKRCWQYYEKGLLPQNTVLSLSQVCQRARPVALKYVWNILGCDDVSSLHHVRRLLHDQKRDDLATHVREVWMDWNFKTADIEESHPRRMGWAVDYSFMDREKIRREARAARGIEEPERDELEMWVECPASIAAEERKRTGSDEGFDWEYMDHRTDYRWGSGPDFDLENDPDEDCTWAWTRMERMPVGYDRAALEEDLLLVLRALPNVEKMDWNAMTWQLPEASALCLGRSSSLRVFKTNWDAMVFEPFVSDTWHVTSAPNLVDLSFSSYYPNAVVLREQSWLRRSDERLEGAAQAQDEVQALGASMSNNLPPNPVFPVDVNLLDKGWDLDDHREEAWKAHLQGRVRSLLTAITVGRLSRLELDYDHLFALRLVLPIWLALDLRAKSEEYTHTEGYTTTKACCNRLQNLRMQLWPCLETFDEVLAATGTVPSAITSQDAADSTTFSALEAAAARVQQICVETNVPDVQVFELSIPGDASDADREQAKKEEEERQKTAIQQDNPRSEYTNRVPPFEKWLAEDLELATNAVRGLLYWRKHHDRSPEITLFS
ncbi:hypothetical protein CBOM_05354 [Ceraceosorus bombacis]|uniref:Uncharacterized protein n=1 Tax=Ceraceosorus bombacis TaxID=401625 RepID=A0A0P1BP58_9BASI|nr:hypothetical protein CBOM_05354 [Ceraceosorus bombacis]